MIMSKSSRERLELLIKQVEEEPKKLKQLDNFMKNLAKDLFIRDFQTRGESHEH